MTGGRRRLIIHIGGGKTGTTAIQRSLAAARAVLPGKGVLYPAAAGGARGVGHDGFGKSFIRVRPFYMKPPADPEGDRLEIAREIGESDAPVILISSEQLELADPALLRDYFEGLGQAFDWRIVFFVRSQDELAESEYNQLVKLGRYRDSFRRYAAEHFHGDFHARAEAWGNVFGRDAIACRVFDAAGPDVMPGFLAAAGLPDNLLAGANLPPPVNRSLGYRALAVVRLLHLMEHSASKPMVQQLMAGEGRDWPALFLTAAEARDFRAQFSASNRALGATYLGGACSDLGGRRHSDEDRNKIRRLIVEDGLTD